jgi:hypothetical protein
MTNDLQLLRKEIYLSFLLSILLFVSIDILSYNYIVLGKEDSKDDSSRREEGGEEAEDNEGSKDDSSRREEGGEEDFEDRSLKELFDDDNDDNNDDNIKEEKEEEDDVPFRLPFRAVPFP